MKLKKQFCLDVNFWLTYPRWLIICKRSIHKQFKLYIRTLLQCITTYSFNWFLSLTKTLTATVFLDNKMKIHLGFFVAYDLCTKFILITYNTKALKLLYPTVPFNNKMVHFKKYLHFVAASEQTALRHKGYNYLPHFCYYWMAVWSSPFLYTIEVIAFC